MINDSVGKVSGGSKLVAQAGLTMEEIVDSIRGVTVMMAEITAASAEQSSGIEQVNQAITQMDNVTQKNAALVEQAAAATESLEEQTQNLEVTVAHFQLDGNSHSASGSVSSGTQVNIGNSFSSAPLRKKTAPTGTGAGKKRESIGQKPQLLTVDAGGWEAF